MNRLVIIPDPNLQATARLLTARLEVIASKLTPENVADAFGTCLGLLSELFPHSPQEELLLWGATPKLLSVAWSSGPAANEVIGTATADRTDGLLALAFTANKEAVFFAEANDSLAWTNLETRRGRAVSWMGASPIRLQGKPVAVLSWVDYDELLPSEENSITRLGRLSQAAIWVGLLLEARLIQKTLGLEE